MSGSVGIVNSATGSVVQTPPPVVASTPTHVAAPTPVSFVHTQRIIQDPAAGFITQYLSANGSEVISQTPSAITVAYLRNGLTADGTHKHVATA
jgi:hypothetical protein